MIRRIGHLCFVTDQLPAMTRFYTEVLGLLVKFDFHNTEGELFGVYIECGDSFIEIFDRVLKVKQWGGPLETPGKGGLYNHFCMEVTGLKDFRDALIAKGLKVSEITSGMDHSLQAWTGDPDGNAIELMEYTHHSLQLAPR